MPGAMKTVVTLLTLTFNISLFVTVFAYALRARRRDLRYMWRRPRSLILSLVALFVLTPAAALIVVETIEIPTTAKVAMVALSLSIIPPLLPQKELAAGGEPGFAIGLTVASAALAVVIIPGQVEFLGDLTGRPYGVPVAEVAGVVATLVAVPLALGLAVGRVWPGASERIGAPLTKLAGLATSIALLVILVLTLPQVIDFISAGTVLAMFLFNVLALAAGHLVGGPDPGREVVLGISCATRHPAIALTIATVNYPGERFTAAVILCLLINAIVVGPYVRWQRQRGRDARAWGPTEATA
jgi:bile acid:Na+ symporter, BASS family